MPKPPQLASLSLKLLLTLGKKAERVTVVVHISCMCLSVSVCTNTLFWQYAQLEDRVKRQICGNIKKAFFLKLSYSKVRAFFTHLGRGGHL